MRSRAFVIVLALVLSSVPAAVADLASSVQQAVKAKDPVAARVLIKKTIKRGKLRKGQSLEVKRIILTHADYIGFDLVDLWNRALGAESRSNFDAQMSKADALMQAKRFNEAFDIYQSNAKWMKKLLAQRKGTSGRFQVEAIYPYVLHSMARALFGAGRLGEALTVYDWIGSDYAKVRQVLFEKMWAAFRLGRVDIALGAIASQRSAYFSRYMHTESYLIQNYLYRKLCRTDELAPILAEIKAYNLAVQSNDIAAWAGVDLESRVLWQIAQASPSKPQPHVTQADRDAEKREIQTALNAEFQRQKPKILADLKTAEAYVHLSDGNDKSTWLKPVEKFPGRQALFDMNLEIWPADSQEEWIDEIGSHRYIGDSQCARNR